MSKPEEFSPELLRTKRLKRGLSIETLAQLVRLKPKTIYCYEAGRCRPSKYYWSCLRRVLNMGKADLELMQKQGDAWITPSKDDSCEPVAFTFECGHCYSIRDTPHTAGAKYEQEINPQSGNFCVFRYEGKSGLHHKFTEVKGCWSRTYTDQQLIGKFIEEIANEQT